MPRTSPSLGVEPLPDKYGQSAFGAIPERRVRKWTAARVKFTHRAKNGVYDPFTYFHLVEELANVKPYRAFTSAQFADHLNGTRPQFIWDAVTVGRILNDLRESWNESNPGAENQPLVVRRQWNGTVYEVTDHAPARAALLALIDDLAIAGEHVHQAEQQGTLVSRLVSPLAACASLVAALAVMVFERPDESASAAAMAVIALGSVAMM